MNKCGKYVASYTMCLHKPCVYVVRICTVHAIIDTDCGMGEGSGSMYSTYIQYMTLER